MEINLFTIGDSNNIETWSNLPYFIANNIEKRGITVNRINIIPHSVIAFLYKLFFGYWINKIFKFLKINKNFSYQKSIFNYYFTRLKILIYCKRYKNADLNFFLMYQFSSFKIDKRPYALLHDQTCEESLNKKGVIKCNNSKFNIEKEKENIEHAEFIYTTNLHSYNFLHDKIKNKNIYLLKGAMKLDEEKIDEEKIIEIKRKSNIILYIGGTWQGRGGDILIKIFKDINDKLKNKLKLVIIGENNINPEYAKQNNIEVYTFLSKRKKKELQKYINFLYRAKLFVMPMRYGPLPGVFIEANYYYTPVITTNIWNAEQMIENGTNGYLIEKPDVKLFVDTILKLLIDEEKYLNLTVKSHDYATKNFRWEIFINDFLDKFENINN